MLPDNGIYVYTRAFEFYSRGLRKAGQQIVNTPYYKWTPERIKHHLKKGFIRRKNIVKKGAEK